MAWVASEADPSLARAARDLVLKLSSAIPKELCPVVLDGRLKPIRTRARPSDRFDGARSRHAIRARDRLRLIYTDRDGARTDRVVWSLLIAFLDRTRDLVGGCETKEDYRHFKTKYIQELNALGARSPCRRAALLNGWEAAIAQRFDR